jgi:hypothetical protein
MVEYYDKTRRQVFSSPQTLPDREDRFDLSQADGYQAAKMMTAEVGRIASIVETGLSRWRCGGLSWELSA